MQRTSQFLLSFNSHTSLGGWSFYSTFQISKGWGVSQTKLPHCRLQTQDYVTCKPAPELEPIKLTRQSGLFTPLEFCCKNMYYSAQVQIPVIPHASCVILDNFQTTLRLLFLIEPLIIKAHPTPAEKRLRSVMTATLTKLLLSSSLQNAHL